MRTVDTIREELLAMGAEPSDPWECESWWPSDREAVVGHHQCYKQRGHEPPHECCCGAKK